MHRQFLIVMLTVVAPLGVRLDVNCRAATLRVPANVAGERPNIIMIYTDDHGYADLSCQGVLDDVRTPHTDKLATRGVRFSSGYCSAPQCRPSRAGLLTGRYQTRFGLEENGDNALPWSEQTIAERLAGVGYVTGMCGKWHLGGTVASNGERPDGGRGTQVSQSVGEQNGPRDQDPGHAGYHGFQEFLCGSMRTYVATHDATGRKLNGIVVHKDPRYRLEVQAQWAASFISRHARDDVPFFLYVPFFAPHVPLEAPEKYLRRFPGEMPRRRRMALAMISAIDDGVGLIAKTLDQNKISENTLIFYISDNGAPLKIDKRDAPGNGPGWDGSLNDPWIGEKGMLTEGGIRVPFLAAWPAKMPAGLVYDRPVIAMDATATALAAGGVVIDDQVDGVDLIPYLTSADQSDPHDALYWRWRGQAAIRQGDWKFLHHGGGRSYLFDLGSKQHETRNLIKDRPQLAERLRENLVAWSQTQLDPGLPQTSAAADQRFFNHYLNRDAESIDSGTTTDATPPRVNQRTAESLFRARDSNRDGVLTLKEYIGNPEGRNVRVLTPRFHRWDANQDGRVTLEELKRP